MINDVWLSWFFINDYRPVNVSPWRIPVTRFSYNKAWQIFQVVFYFLILVNGEYKSYPKEVDWKNKQNSEYKWVTIHRGGVNGRWVTCARSHSLSGHHARNSVWISRHFGLTTIQLLFTILVGQARRSGLPNFDLHKELPIGLTLTLLQL